MRRIVSLGAALIACQPTANAPTRAGDEAPPAASGATSAAITAVASGRIVFPQSTPPPPSPPPEPTELEKKVRALWAAEPKVTRASNMSARELEALNAICNVRQKNGVAGCACCPGELGKQCLWSPDERPEPRFVPQRIVGGSFTRLRADELLMADNGECGVNMGSYGAFVVAGKEAGSWQIKQQFRGVTIREALVWPRDGSPDLLIGLLVSGKRPWYRVVALQLDRPLFAQDRRLEDENQHLVGWSDGTTNCFLLDDGMHLGWAELVGSAVRDHNRDAKPDLMLRLKARGGKMNKRVKKACDAILKSWETNGPAGVNPVSLLPQRTFELWFTFDGMKFVPSKQVTAFEKFVGGD
jgi:hypothetical protein